MGLFPQNRNGDRIAQPRGKDRGLAWPASSPGASLRYPALPFRPGNCSSFPKAFTSGSAFYPGPQYFPIPSIFSLQLDRLSLRLKTATREISSRFVGSFLCKYRQKSNFNRATWHFVVVLQKPKTYSLSDWEKCYKILSLGRRWND